MDEPKTFIASEKALAAVISQIKDSQWSMDADVLMPGKSLTLREIVNYHTYDSKWVPQTLAGKTIAEVGDTYDGDLLGDDPKAAYAKASAAAVAAVEALTTEDLDRTIHFTYGDFSVRDGLKHITCYRGFRAYTIAKFIGVDTTMPADLVDGLWDEVVPEVESWRSMGVFGPAIDPLTDADKQTKLLCLTGFYHP